MPDEPNPGRDPCPGWRATPTPRGVLLRARPAPGAARTAADGRLVAYAFGAPVTGAVRVVLGDDLLGTDLLDRYLRSLPPAIRRRVVVDVGALDPRPSAAAVAAVADRLGVAVDDGTSGPLHELARLGHAAVGAAYRAATDPQARASVAYHLESSVLPDVAGPLARLAAATAGAPLDRATAAVLAALDHVLTVARPDPGRFNSAAILCLPGPDRLACANWLMSLRAPLQDAPARLDALGALILLVLSCGDRKRERSASG
ncbi:hypothetical protein ACQEVZ_40100 [Dactylosporangium sp. CA-152071]|uniref:hypothetical protein n=1 Tax=Dactylosporangium sp. CA-152071 TaxID=3239933 RepID=UPI003D94C049